MSTVMTKEMLRDLMPVLKMLTEGKNDIAKIYLEDFIESHMECCDECHNSAHATDEFGDLTRQAAGGGGC